MLPSHPLTRFLNVKIKILLMIHFQKRKLCANSEFHCHQARSKSPEEYMTANHNAAVHTTISTVKQGAHFGDYKFLLNDENKQLFFYTYLT
jgi:hypothetical protein